MFIERYQETLDQASVYRGAYFKFWGGVCTPYAPQKKGGFNVGIASFLYQDKYFSDPKCPIYRYSSYMTS